MRRMDCTHSLRVTTLAYLLTQSLPPCYHSCLPPPPVTPSVLPLLPPSFLSPRDPPPPAPSTQVMQQRAKARARAKERARQEMESKMQVCNGHYV